MFSNVIVESAKGPCMMYEQISKRSLISYNLKRRMLSDMISKINLVLQLKVLHDIFFIKALLLKIELTKRIFVIDLEQG